MTKQDLAALLSDIDLLHFELDAAEVPDFDGAAGRLGLRVRWLLNELDRLKSAGSVPVRSEVSGGE